MARKKGKKRSSRRGRGKRKGTRHAPRTVRGVFKQQPLLVKGGILLSGMEMLTDTQYGGTPLKTAIGVFKKTDTTDNLIMRTSGAITNVENYYPIVIGFLGHKAAKMLGIKGF